jgi:hypothetical protein
MLARVPLGRLAGGLALCVGAALAIFALVGRGGADSGDGPGDRRPVPAAAATTPLLAAAIAAAAAPLTLLADVRNTRETIAGMPVVWAVPPQGEPRGVVLLFHG